MSATPIIPGRLYRVRARGLDVAVIARDAFAAIIIMLPRVMPCEA
ncbi:hypothetical protein [Castellaniella sp.]|nr:hypothetical protein [Castellaniella sp.]